MSEIHARVAHLLIMGKKRGPVERREMSSRKPSYIKELLRSVTTKGNRLNLHGHEGERPIGEEAYKILYPLGGRPTPSGCTGVDQSEERDPSNITLYG